MWFAYLFAALPLVTWWATGLFDLDEGFYGAVTAEMLRRGDFITPYYNGQPWFEKPILLYWLAAPFMKVFGIWIGPRIPSVLCTIGLYIICGRFAKRHMGEWQARHVVYCLGTSLLVIALGRLMMTDALLNLCLTGAFLSFWEHLHPSETPISKLPTANLLTAFFLGLGVLAKGPVCLLLFAPIAAITYYQNSDLRPKVFKGFLPAFAVLVATVSTWYVPCYLANHGDFVQKFLIEQNLNRFTGGDAAHSLGIKGLPFYIPILLIAVIPWGFTEAKRIWQSKTANPLNRYLFTWAATIFIFFTVSSAKLPHYILPVIAPLALLASNSLATKEKTQARNMQVVMGVSILLLFLISGLQTSWYVKSGQAEVHYLISKYPHINVMFQMSRRGTELATGTTDLQETSLPSLVMFSESKQQLGIRDVDDPKEAAIPTFVLGVKDAKCLAITRKGRVESAWGWKLLEATQHYEVYEIPGDVKGWQKRFTEN